MVDDQVKVVNNHLFGRDCPDRFDSARPLADNRRIEATLFEQAIHSGNVVADRIASGEALVANSDVQWTPSFLRENKSLLLVRDCAVILVSKKHPIDKLTELRALLVKSDNAIRLETADLYFFKTSKDESEFQ